ncbi:MAG: hypothetical protein H6741_34010 [Alphaproteobacteria bacterium]|nr:hypothetical protein [Alphaproteobacteria bacterium]MCB9797734.1 hypothetical protein [Alphaproteobacteria bacterium]
MILLALALGCTAPEPHDSVAVVDSHDSDDADDSGVTDDSTATDDSAEPSGLRGRAVDPPLPPPAFEVQNHERLARTADWLAGAPTVLWFFRDASEST